MDHIGIDLGGKESQVCIRSSTGEILSEQKLPTPQLGELLAQLPPSRAVMETCAEAFAVGLQLRAAGHQVRIVPATLVKTLGVGARGVKTDKRDARVLSEVSCRIELPSVHIPSPSSLQLRAMLQGRQALLESRTALINSVKGYLRTQLLKLPRGGTVTLTGRVRQALAGRSTTPAVIESLLVVLDALNQQIEAADVELEAQVKASPVCRLLMTAPGVGPVTAARFVAAIDDPLRFQSARQVRSYIGLTPGEHSSSERQRTTGLTKAGPTNLRACLVQGAWCVLRSRQSSPLKDWATEMMARRPKQVVVCALARKTAGILWAMWRDGKPYDPTAACREQTPSSPVATVA
jgi:transposase